jgi:flagellar biosynthetic protein FlhB
MANSSKTEKPTPRRRQKARAKGQVARTRELPSVLGCTAALAIFSWQASQAAQEWRGFLRSTLDMSARQALAPETTLFLWSGWQVVRWSVPVMLGAWVVSAATSVMQGGLVFAPDALAPKPERLSPANKLRQMFSLTGLSGLLKSLLPFAAILYLGIGVFRQHWPEIVLASSLELRSFARLVFKLAFEVGWKSLLVLLVWAGVDYFFTWRKLESDLRMSRQELREEIKESEGDPSIKGRIRRLQRQVRRQQMLKAAETATAVVTNPTHFAVALRYEHEMPAPIVVAKGRDMLAEQIKEVARWHGIPTLENPPLAQVLYRTVAVGQEIPAKLYIAVAEILALIHRARAQARAASAQRDSGGRE